jgi:hypothetical protein
MKGEAAGNENITKGTMIQAQALNSLRMAMYNDTVLSEQEMEKVKREFSRDLQCAVRHFEVGFEQLTGHEG